MVGSIQIVEYALPQAPLRSSVDLSSDHCFPAIGNQGAQGSCTAWAATYYATGYVQAKLHNWNLAYQGNTDQLLSPAWTYNKCNYGIDQGSSIFANMDVSQTVGVCRLSKMPYDDTDYISWGNENAWRDAPPYRVNNTYTLPLGINSVKAIIAAGYPVTFALDANSYANFGTDDVLGSNAMGYSLNHANTVVGYDDSKVDHETGQVGAFKIVNSWGQWGPDYNGYYWITYQAFLGSWNFGGLNCVDCRYVNDHPKLLGIWNLNPQCDRSADVVLGIGPHSNPVETRTPWWSGSGHSMHQYPSFMCLDITEFMDTWAMNVTSFYLQIGDAATDGTITSFKVEYYENSYTLGSLSCISSESPDTPKNTPCYVTLDFFKISSVYIGSLNIHQTSWGISLATIPNTNVPINGEQLVFYADFYMDCPGSADDGYVDISFLDGTGSASAHTGTHLEDTLLISHLMVPGQQVTIKLHLKYTDWWGSQTIYEMTSYNSAATLPATPLNLNAYNPTRKSIDLSWTKGIGADKTKILRKIGGYPNSPNDGTQVYFGTDSSFNDTGLTSSTTYYYRAWSYWSTINNNSIGYSQDQEKTLANIPPMSNFTYSPFNPTTSDTIQFNETSTDLDGNIVAWSWKFGDGAITTLPNPSHKYTNSGVYMVTLNVTDDDGAQGTKSKSISVSNTPPIANFSYTPLNPKTSDTIQFTDISTDSDGTIISWFWRFGDGSTSTQQNPEHQYSDNVDYTV
ncbi:MAG: PKD domain-containing protein, partial [Thermoplasmata archaeon]|nr:PKD domain-containing protein [Thermoplasmata archaeon]